MSTQPPFVSEDGAARQYSRLVTKAIRPYFLKGGDADDLYQEGMIGLLKAIRTYDVRRNDSFEAYALLCIRSRLIDAIRASALASQKEHAAISHFMTTSDIDTINDPETQCLANESAKEIKDALSGLLSAFETSVLDPYLEGYTVSEISALLGRSVKSADNAVTRIRRKLAHYLKTGDNGLK